MITSEKELQDELVIHLTEQGFNCQQYVPNSIGIADVVIDNAVLELKHLPDRDALYKAVGQAILYRGAINKNLDAKIICSYSSNISLSILESASIAVKQFGLELLPWQGLGAELTFQTDHIIALPNNYSVGDICLVSSLCQLELLKYNKYWAIVTEVREYGCLVRLLEKEVFLRTQHLKKLDLEVEQATQIKLMSDRILKLAMLMELDPMDRAQLDVMQTRTIWTNRQLLLLRRMEEDYSVNVKIEV